MCPGTVDTEWIGMILADAADPGATRAAMEARQLDGRFVNGSAFVMDGGVTAR